MMKRHRSVFIADEEVNAKSIADFLFFARNGEVFVLEGFGFEGNGKYFISEAVFFDMVLDSFLLAIKVVGRFYIGFA